MNTDTRSAAAGIQRRWRPLAWWSLALLPLSFVLAFVVGEGIASWFEGPEQTASPPWWIMLAALVSATVILAAPLALTAYFSRKAAARGEQGAMVPLVVGASLVGVFVVVNAASAVLTGILG